MKSLGCIGQFFFKIKYTLKKSSSGDSPHIFLSICPFNSQLLLNGRRGGAHLVGAVGGQNFDGDMIQGVHIAQ